MMVRLYNMKNKGPLIVTRMKGFLPPESSLLSVNRYLNLSVYNYLGVALAAVPRVVRGLPDEQYLPTRRNLGSIPGSGAAPTYILLNFYREVLKRI